MPLSNEINIDSGEIHLWLTDDTQCDNQALLAQYHSMLGDSERTQQQRFHFEKHRHQYLVTRALLRTVLSHYEPSISPAEWQFQKNEYGKPFLTNPITKRLKFNLSHTDRLVALAVTLDKEVGVDVENLSRSNSTSEIAERFFSPSETKALLELPSHQHRDRFFDLWTLKEAYIKACGMGLSIPLNHFSYSFNDKQISIDFAPERDDTPELWEFWQFLPSDNHKAAVAIKHQADSTNDTLLMRRIIPQSEIVEVDYPITRWSQGKPLS